MLALTPRAKEAIKTALAMTIAYGVALSMDWPNPHWAGFAVAFISLSTVGQSLNKGLMRMAGTLLAAVFSLALIALFPQERWWFFLVLSSFVGLCTYLMGGSGRQYFWNVAGFVSLIVCMSSVPATENAFAVAVVRILETGLGILVYTLVTVLVWPTGTREELDAAVRRLAATQHELYRQYRGLLQGKGTAEDTRALRMREVQEFGQFRQALAAARTDSYEVWEARRQWQQVQDLSAALMENLERWRESFAEVKDLDLTRLLPNFDALYEELDDRAVQIERMLERQAPEHAPRDVELDLDKDAERSLAHFQKAALAVTRARLQHLDALSRSLFEVLADIKGFETAAPRSWGRAAPRPRLVLDPDRLTAAVRVMAGLWLAYLAWIYTEIPGGTAFVIMAGPFGMALATMPQMRVSMLAAPAAVGIAFASILYIFVMPQLSSFSELGPMIFAATFVICYLYHTPKQGLGRAFGLAMFVTIAGISNQQSYSFLSVANTALMFPLLFAVLGIAANIPFSARPEKAFLRVLGRFFRSGEQLMITMPWHITTTPTRLARWRRTFHLHEVETLPRKLAAWGKALDTAAVPGTTPEQVQALTTNLQALTYRMQELMDARESPQARFLVGELLTDVRAWRLRVQEAFLTWGGRGTPAPADVLRERLTARLTQLERRIEETMNKATASDLSGEDRERLYRLLGAYRGLSEAGVEYARTAEGIEWDPWRESRF